MADDSEPSTCQLCGADLGEDGLCVEDREPCFYCPESSTCEECGAGFCDQSC